jgi:NAD(P)-dependent dehydrogenase (short-subunit alcohol dehydrogenase family)
MKKDLVIAMTGAHSRLGRALAGRLRAEGHTVVPVPRDYARLPGSDVFIHLGGGSRRLAERLPDALTLPELLLTTATGMKPAEALGIHVTPLQLKNLRPEEASDMILWALHLLENRECLD